jgi:hypothetical protein
MYSLELERIIKNRPTTFAPPTMEENRNPALSEADAERRESIIAQAFETPEGRATLCHAMAEPIIRSLEMHGLARKILLVDRLGGGISRYEKTNDIPAYCLGRRNVNGDVRERKNIPLNDFSRVIDGNEILVPTCEIAAYPQIRLSEIRARRFYIVDRAQMKAKEAIQKQEDNIVIELLEKSVRGDQTLYIDEFHKNYTNNLLSSFLKSFSYIENHDLIVGRIIMHPKQYVDVRLFGGEMFEEATRRDVLSNQIFGYFKDAEISVSHRVPEGSIYFLAPAEDLGVMPIRQGITVLPADDPQNLRLGWIIYEEIGACVLYDYAIAKIEVRNIKNTENPFLSSCSFSGSFSRRSLPTKHIFSRSFGLPAFYGNRSRNINV